MKVCFITVCHTAVRCITACLCFCPPSCEVCYCVVNECVSLCVCVCVHLPAVRCVTACLCTCPPSYEVCNYVVIACTLLCVHHLAVRCVTVVNECASLCVCVCAPPPVSCVSACLCLCPPSCEVCNQPGGVYSLQQQHSDLLTAKTTEPAIP